MDPTVFDPSNLDPAIFLTAAGAPIAGAILAAVIQALKRLPRLGTLLDDGKEVILNMVGSAALVGLGFTAAGLTLDVITGFAAFLAWLNIVTVTNAAYAAAPDGLKTALGGTPSGG